MPKPCLPDRRMTSRLCSVPFGSGSVVLQNNEISLIDPIWPFEVGAFRFYVEDLKGRISGIKLIKQVCK